MCSLPGAYLVFGYERIACIPESLPEFSGKHRRPGLQVGENPPENPKEFLLDIYDRGNMASITPIDVVRVECIGDGLHIELDRDQDGWWPVHKSHGNPQMAMACLRRAPGARE